MGGYCEAQKKAQVQQKTQLPSAVRELVNALDKQRLCREITLALGTGLEDAQADFSFLRVRGLFWVFSPLPASSFPSSPSLVGGDGRKGNVERPVRQSHQLLLSRRALWLLSSCPVGDVDIYTPRYSWTAYGETLNANLVWLF
ncbi:hypothetical protein U1Q18_035291 [Sarracenia purpurea var. burkii]